MRSTSKGDTFSRREAHRAYSRGHAAQAAIPSSRAFTTPPRLLMASERVRESRLTKTKRGIYRLTASIMNCTAVFTWPSRTHRAEVFSPSTSSTRPIQMAMKMICRELPSRKGVTILPGMIPSSIR